MHEVVELLMQTDEFLTLFFQLLGTLLLLYGFARFLHVIREKDEPF